jgi:hypothetical protein
MKRTKTEESDEYKLVSFKFELKRLMKPRILVKKPSITPLFPCINEI